MNWFLKTCVLLVFCVSCGRIGYDPIAVDDGAPAIDATLVKEGEITLTDVGSDANNPSIVWNGNGFGLAWHDTRGSGLHIYFARLDATGAKIGNDVQITTGTANARDPKLVWTGSGYGLVWRDDPGSGIRDIRFARLDSNGALLAAPVQLTSDIPGLSHIAMVHTGDRFAIAWSDDRTGGDEVQFTAFDNGGLQLVSPIQVVTAAGRSVDPTLSYSANSGLVMSWADSRDGSDQIYSVGLSTDGEQLAPPLQLTTASSSEEPQIVQGGSQLGFAYGDSRTGVEEIFFSAHLAGGAITVDGLQLSSGAANPPRASIASDNSGFLVAWEHDLHVRYAYIVEGVVQSTAQVDSGNGDAKSPAVAWTGQQFVVIWEDQRNVFDDILYLKAIAL